MEGPGVIVLDTHALLWMDRNDPMLGPQARGLIENTWRSDVVAVSAISFWETALLADRGRIVLPVPAEAWRLDLLQAGLREIPVDGRIALLATRLEGLHRDPADRFIVATSLQLGATLVTADSEILGWAGNLPRQAATA
jgi:PIN domain nuclease of toxin-antitoxin system